MKVAKTYKTESEINAIAPKQQHCRLQVGTAYVICFLQLFLYLCLPTSALTDELPTGAEIAQKVYSRPEGKTLQRNLHMKLINKNGKIRERQTVVYRKDYEGVRKNVLFFQQPKNLKGTGFLTWDYHDSATEDNQWVYLPATRKVRRITASKQGDYFFGTDLTYDDMKKEGKGNLEDFSRQTLGREMIDGHECYKVEALPVNSIIAKELGYGKVHQWIDPISWMVLKTKVWDTRENDLKTIHFKDIKKVDGIWTAGRIEAENHKTGHQTHFTFTNIQYNQEINDSLFTSNNLKRSL